EREKAISAVADELAGVNYDPSYFSMFRRAGLPPLPSVEVPSHVRPGDRFNVQWKWDEGLLKWRSPRQGETPDIEAEYVRPTDRHPYAFPVSDAPDRRAKEFSTAMDRLRAQGKISDDVWELWQQAQADRSHPAGMREQLKELEKKSTAELSAWLD